MSDSEDEFTSDYEYCSESDSEFEEEILDYEIVEIILEGIRNLAQSNIKSSRSA